MVASSTIPDTPKISDFSFASSMDRKEHFYAESQQAWLNLSEEIIANIATNLNSFTTFYDLYDSLREKRLVLARYFKHGWEENFGAWRKLDGCEHLVDDKRHQIWGEQKDKVFQLLNEIIAKIPENKYCSYTKSSPSKENLFFTSIMSPQTPSDSYHTRETIIFSASTSLATEEDKKLTEVLELQLLTSSTKKHLKIVYPPMLLFPRDYFAKQFKLADEYFQFLRKWSPADGIDSFVGKIGELAHLMAIFMPVSRGNSSIVEWIMRGIAFSKSIHLGPFNHTEKIGWDFKAFLTVDRKEYAKWFAEKAFAHCQMVPLEKKYRFDITQPELTLDQQLDRSRLLNKLSQSLGTSSWWPKRGFFKEAREFYDLFVKDIGVVNLATSVVRECFRK